MLEQERAGFLLVRVGGVGARRLFSREGGGHRWQRVPPSEKRGRVHSSTVTVVVMPEPARGEFRLDPRELSETFTGGGGKGGQHQNKRSTAVVLVHRPSGVRVRIEGRSQADNRRLALEVLRARLASAHARKRRLARNAARREQAGNGMRGDKVRTVQVKNGVVVDHRNGKRIPFRSFERGELHGLFDG